MAHEILSIKMYELDKKIGRLRSRIQMSESASHDWVRAEVHIMQSECEEEETALRERLRYSKSSVVARLSEAYSRIEAIIREAKAQTEEDADASDEDFPVEEKILVAEYALDFAMQAVDHALMVAMSAMDTYMTNQESEETKT